MPILYFLTIVEYFRKDLQASKFLRQRVLFKHVVIYEIKNT